MRKETFIPDSYKLTYKLNNAKKTFTEFILTNYDLELLTNLIRIEKNNGYNSISGANWLLRIRNGSNWTKCTLTGLRPTKMPNFYYADLPVNNKKSLCVIKHTIGTDELQIRVCKQFYCDVPHHRENLINHLITNF